MNLDVHSISHRLNLDVYRITHLARLCIIVLFVDYTRNSRIKQYIQYYKKNGLTTDVLKVKTKK